MKVKLGTVFWKDDPNGGHHYVIITPPSQPEVVIVSFTTQGPRKDQSCILRPGSHPCIVDETVVAFDYAQVVPTEAVQRMVDDGTFVVKEDASEEVLLAIWEGGFKTNRMTIRCRELLSRTVPN